MARIRGVLAELVVMSSAIDPFLSLKALGSYSGMSVRKLREHLEDLARPLPHYRVGGKILVRRSEFDQWMHQFRRRGNADVERVVNEVLRDIERA